MMKWLISGMLMLFCSVAVGSDVFSEANQDFDGGRFEESIKGYELLLENEGPRVSVLNNLGSAYFRLGDHARAILSFERALVLSPGDPDLLANLKLAQEQAAVFPEQTARGWRGFLSGVSPDSRAILALLAAVVLPLAACAMFRFPGAKRWGLLLVLLALAVLKVVLRPMKDQIDPESRAVVLATPATVRLSPFESAESKGTLSSGREVVLGQSESGFFWVEANGGAMQGWVHEGDVDCIVPTLPDQQE